MSDIKIERLKDVNDFESLIKYLRDELLWPIELENVDDITFDYNPKDLGIEEKYAAKIRTIKQIRPFTDTQPWGIFFIEFEPKKLPVIVMRRILRALIHTRRSYDDKSPTWNLHDLMLISSLGEEEERKISFAHFTESEQGLPELRTFSWDVSDTYFHYLQNKLDLDKLHWPRNDQDIAGWRDQWSSAFTRRHREVIRTSQQLAVEMARLAAQIRDQIKIIYEYEISNGPLHKLFGNFKSVLIHDLEINAFADMYAQTIAYGLFSARATHEGDFIVEDIPAMIPNTNPFLKKLFEECTNIEKSCKEDTLDLDEIGVTELIKTLKESNIEAVLQDFGRQKQGEDPVVHFYELFLREYDAEQKVKRGVFYTPDPVVSFIVRSVDHILKTEFDCPDGFADTSKTQIKKIRPKKKGNGYIEEEKSVPKVQILDPAVGTGTFLKHVIEIIKKTFDEKHGNLTDEELKNKWNEYVSNDLFSRLFGFELMMAPYAVCHLKLGIELAETGYDFTSVKRLGVFLTNTLEGTHEGSGTLDAYLNWLADEGHKANIIKNNKPISVIIGNPPYSNYGMLNKSDWIMKLLEDYKKDIDEKKINLDDDYLKFLRFVQWRLERTGEGVIGLITNNSYLDGITHRTIRKNLLETFDKIYILNLHGNTNKGEPDKNVFDIKIGVSIILLIKSPKNMSNKNIFYFSTLENKLIKREDKYKFLQENDIQNINWDILTPDKPNYWFIKKDLTLEDEYKKGWLLSDIFKIWGSGIQTDRDSLFIDSSRHDLEKRMKILFAGNWDAEFIENYNVRNSSSYNILDRLRNKFYESKNIKKIYYRPFDLRWIYYKPGVTSRPAYEIMQHFQDKVNLSLNCEKIWNLKREWSGVYVSNVFSEGHLTSSKSYVFPLFNDKNKNPEIMNNEIYINSNFTNNFIEFIKNQYQFIPTPEEIFYYIYSILNSLSYRKRYYEFLKTGYPVIPFVKDPVIFKRLSMLGKDLVDYHLLNKSYNNLELESYNESFRDKSITKIKYEKNSGNLWINNIDCFKNIPLEVYLFEIGGYPVCQKWLKERKNKKLEEDDINTFKKIILSIKKTLIIMKNIDRIIEENGSWPID